MSRSGSVSRWSELLDSSTQPPPYQSPERHSRKLKSLSTPTPSRADSKSSDSQLSSRRVLFAVDEGEGLSGRGRNKRSNPASVTYPPPTRATKLDSRSNARERSKASKATTPSTARKSHASAKQGQAAVNGGSSSEEDGHVDGEGGSMRHSRHLQAPEQQRQARLEEQGLNEDEMDSGGDSIEADSDYDELMSLRRNNLPTPHAAGAASRSSTKMCGVGMQVEIDKHGRVRVTKLAEGGAAAEHGGIVEGDAIEAVDGVPLRAKSLEQVNPKSPCMKQSRSTCPCASFACSLARLLACFLLHAVLQCSFSRCCRGSMRVAGMRCGKACDVSLHLASPICVCCDVCMLRLTYAAVLPGNTQYGSLARQHSASCV